MGAVDFSIDMRLVETLRRVLPISVFVETGTFEGEAVARARESFDEVYSIELSDHYHARAAERFAGDAGVRLYHGDSSRVLASLRPTLEDKATLYWLDAHWCVADETAGEQSQCPLLDELTALGRLNTESVVLIDDARLFLATPPYPHEASNWPRLQEVVERLLLLSSDHELMVVNDVIVFFPGAALTAVSDHARSYGIDWLAQLHRLAELEHERDQLAGIAIERLEAIESLTRAAEDRATLIEQLKAALATIDELTRERDLQATTAAERLAAIEELMDERDRLVAEALEHAALVAELERERDLQARTADERLASIEELTRERDALAAAAAERLDALEQLASERDRGPRRPRSAPPR